MLTPRAATAWGWMSPRSWRSGRSFSVIDNGDGLVMSVKTSQAIARLRQRTISSIPFAFLQLTLNAVAGSLVVGHSSEGRFDGGQSLHAGRLREPAGDEWSCDWKPR